MPDIDDPLSLLKGNPESPVTAMLQRVRVSLDAMNRQAALQQCQLIMNLYDNASDIRGLALAQAHMAYIQGLSNKQWETNEGDKAADVAMGDFRILKDEHNEAITCLIRAYVRYKAQAWNRSRSAYSACRDRLEKLYRSALATGNVEQAKEYGELKEQICRRLEEIAQTIAERYMPPAPPDMPTAGPYKAPPVSQVAQHSLLFLPVIGSIPAGQAVISNDDVQNVLATVDQVDIDGTKYYIKRLCGEGNLVRFNWREYEYYLSQVVGDSMNLADVVEGDYVILRQPRDLPTHPDTQDIVAASVTDIDREVTLKRYIREGRATILRPESSNPKHQPYEFLEDDPRVNVVAVAVAVLKPVE
jgi:hypothetical protein